jgi:hypothetical protein
MPFGNLPVRRPSRGYNTFHQRILMLLGEYFSWLCDTVSMQSNWIVLLRNEVERFQYWPILCSLWYRLKSAPEAIYIYILSAC